MIKRLRVRNFQSHEDTELSFEPGVNAIVGRSDSGKTALLRALRWVVTNRPTGDSFRSEWGGDTVVEVETDNSVVSRERTSTTNLYKVDGTELEAIGTSVPEEVARALNIHPEINLQAQFDRPFLLDSTPGEVSRTLNKVARLDIIDESRKLIEKWLREAESSLKFKIEELEKTEEELEGYDFLPKLEIELEVLEEMEERRKRLSSSCERLKSTLRKLREIRREIREEAKIASQGQGLDEALSMISYYDKLLERTSDIRRLTRKIITTRIELEKLEALAEPEESVDDLLKMFARAHEIELQADKLRQKVNAAIKVSSELREQEEELQQLRKEFEEEAPEVCPLCGRKWKK